MQQNRDTLCDLLSLDKRTAGLEGSGFALNRRCTYRSWSAEKSSFPRLRMYYRRLGRYRVVTYGSPTIRPKQRLLRASWSLGGSIEQVAFRLQSTKEGNSESEIEIECHFTALQSRLSDAKIIATLLFAGHATIHAG